MPERRTSTDAAERAGVTASVFPSSSNGARGFIVSYTETRITTNHRAAGPDPRCLRCLVRPVHSTTIWVGRCWSRNCGSGASPVFQKGLDLNCLRKSMTGFRQAVTVEPEVGGCCDSVFDGLASVHTSNGNSFITARYAGTHGKPAGVFRPPRRAAKKSLYSPYTSRNGLTIPYA